jgi:hypothetical protein
LRLASLQRLLLRAVFLHQLLRLLLVLLLNLLGSGIARSLPAQLLVFRVLLLLKLLPVLGLLRDQLVLLLLVLLVCLRVP